VSYTREDVLRATGNLTGKTIPVHVRIEATQIVLSQPEMRELLFRAETIAVGNCVCREEERNCDAPLEVCLALDDEARQKMADGRWRGISRDDALALLEETYRHGLVHMAYRRGDDGEIRFVCSCCTCCCGPLNGLKAFDYRDAIAESAYVACHSEADCVGCGACVPRCPFGAYARAEDSDEIAFSADRCFGCGLCVGTCPAGAIRLVRRDAV